MNISSAVLHWNIWFIIARNILGCLPSDILDTAYQEACEKGTTTSFRAKLDIIGQTDVGKTSLSRRLLGQPFVEEKESTEGISTHFVKSHFNPKELNTEIWLESKNDSKDILSKFNNEILMEYDKLTQNRTKEYVDKPQQITVTPEAMSTTSQSTQINNIEDYDSIQDANINKKGTQLRDLQTLTGDPTNTMNINFEPVEKRNSVNSSDLEEGQQERNIVVQTNTGDNTEGASSPVFDHSVPPDMQFKEIEEHEVTLNNDILEDQNSLQVHSTLFDTREESPCLTDYENKKEIMTKETGIIGMSSKTKEQLLYHHRFKLDTSSTADLDYSLRLWDYGGHTEFLATHHLFLNIESTTLILLDVSKKLKDPIKRDTKTTSGSGVPNTPEQFLHYWLKILHSQTTEKNFHPNIALVLTHKDMIQGTDVDKYIKEFKLEILMSIEGKPYSHYITHNNIFVIDNKNGDQKDFARLRNVIFKMIAEQKSWGIERPTRWLKLEADILHKTTEESIKFLPWLDVKELAKAYGITDDELLSFLKFHHKLGDFIYYDKPGLKDVVITDPQWLADMFKTLITAHEFIDLRDLDPAAAEQIKQGRVSFDVLHRIWEEDSILLLKQLFQNFNLLLPIQSSGIGEENFIIPCMLPPINKNMYEMEPLKSMILAYNSQYNSKCRDPLPVGTFHRLLSDCSKSWSICVDKHLSYTDASFKIEGKMIRASVWFSEDAFQDSSVLLHVREVLDSKLLKLGIPSCNRFLLICPHWKAEDDGICLVSVKEVLDDSDMYKIQPAENICYCHGKNIHEIHFPTPRTSEN